MSSKTDKRLMNEMRNFAQSAEKKVIPQKTMAQIFEEDNYVAPVSVRQKPKSRVMYVEDLDVAPKNPEPPAAPKPITPPPAEPVAEVPPPPPMTTNKPPVKPNNGERVNHHHKKQKGKYNHQPRHKSDKKGISKLSPNSTRLLGAIDTPRSVSKVSNLIREDIEVKEIFEQIVFKGRHRMSSENFYRDVGNAIYHSLLQFLDIERFEEGEDPVSGRQLWGYNLPMVDESLPNIGSWYFFDRVYHEQDISFETDASIMDKYRAMFKDYQGIDIEWLEVFRLALKKKFYFLPNTALNIIIDSIREVWCVDSDSEPETVVNVPAAQAPTSTVGYAKDIEDVEEDNAEDPPGDEQDPPSQDSSYYSDEEEDARDNISVESVSYMGINRLTIMPRNHHNITFCINIDGVSTECETLSLVDSRNGMWDWLMHFIPNMMFRTLEPEKYIPDHPSQSVADTKIIILDEDDGLYTMGIYCVDTDLGTELLEDGSVDVNHCNFIQRINNIIAREIASTSISHRAVTLKMEDLFWEEEEILDYIQSTDEEEDDSTSTDEKAPETTIGSAFDEAIKLAQAKASGVVEPPTDDEVEDGDEETDEEPADETDSTIVDDSSEDDSAPDPEDDPPYPGTVESEPDSDFIWEPPQRRKNKYNS